VTFEICRHIANCLQANQHATARLHGNSSSRGSTRREAACFSSGSTATVSSPALDCFSTKVLALLWTGVYMTLIFIFNSTCDVSCNANMVCKCRLVATNRNKAYLIDWLIETSSSFRGRSPSQSLGLVLQATTTTTTTAASFTAIIQDNLLASTPPPVEDFVGWFCCPYKLCYPHALAEGN